ncbi:DNA adenine methylase [Bosea vaviloviae]|uniref:site-specific DNA-methyltransferase (adenine-specific) n=1 Tax=Bosea vaviloviae TaxID=1526658 RepID=A0A0N1N3I5_9HYPH|nr:DNA adenine methylase [Bosea vaviloviae]KPH80511.1 DNA methyltransferase [Bosea vaviloviae]
MDSVIPVNPVAGYVGGKKQLARTIIARIGAIDHELYAEPFVGMGGVFLRRPARPKVEAINDASQDVATFFRVLQRHYQAFLDMLKWQVTSRAEFARLAAQDPATLTDLERSARFLYLQRLSFGGKVASRSFGIDTHSPARFDITRLVPTLEAVHERLAGVWIDCLGWEAFIQRWDRPTTLFYLDPPYWGTEHYYGRDLFVRADFERLNACLRGLQGRFILSLNDVPEVHKLFDWATIEAVELSYQAGGAEHTKRVREVIICPPI